MARITRQTHSDRAVPSTEPPARKAPSRAATTDGFITQPTRLTRARSRQVSDENNVGHHGPRRGASERQSTRMSNIDEEQSLPSDPLAAQEADEHFAHDAPPENEVDLVKDVADSASLSPYEQLSQGPPSQYSQCGTSIPPADQEIPVIELDIQRFIRELKDLYENTKRILSLVLLENEVERDDFISRVVDASSSERETFEVYAMPYDHFRNRYASAHGYIEPLPIVQKLFGLGSVEGPWRPDDILFMVNLAKMLINISLTESEPRWETLASIESLFPRLIAGYQYDREAFELALNLTTQTMLARLEQGADQLTGPDGDVRGYFMTRMEDGNEQYKHWHDLKLDEQARVCREDRADEIAKRLSDLRIPRRRLRPEDILQGWREKFPWDRFAERLLAYCKERENELTMRIERYGGVAGIQNAIKEAMEEDHEAEEQPVSQPRPSLGHRYNDVDRRRKANEYDQVSTNHFHDGLQLTRGSQSIPSSLQAPIYSSMGYSKSGTRAFRAINKGTIPKSNERKRKSPLPASPAHADHREVQPRGTSELNRYGNQDYDDDAQVRSPEMSTKKRQRVEGPEVDDDGDDNDGEFESMPTNSAQQQERRRQRRLLARSQDHAHEREADGESGWHQLSDEARDSIQVAQSSATASRQRGARTLDQSQSDAQPPVRTIIQAGDGRKGKARATEPRRDDGRAPSSPHERQAAQINRWGQDDESPTPTLQEKIAATKNRTWQAGLINSKGRVPWTAEEEATLRTLLESHSAGELSYSALKNIDKSRTLHQRDAQQIRDKARNMCKAMVIQLGSNRLLPQGWKYVALPENMIAIIRSRGAEWLESEALGKR